MDNSNNNENIEDKGKGREDKIASIVHNKTKDTYEGSIDKNTVDIWVKTVVTALGNEGQLKIIPNPMVPMPQWSLKV